MEPIVGVPHQGLHRARIPIVNISLFDTLLTMLLALFIEYYSGIHIIIVFIMLILISIVAHKQRGTQTQLLKYLGIK